MRPRQGSASHSALQSGVMVQQALLHFPCPVAVYLVLLEQISITSTQVRCISL